MVYEPDEVDRQLLTLLQEDARYSAIDLAEKVGVSDNTVHNRMNRLEEAGVITGYAASVDHSRTGLALHFHFACTARISQRANVADEIMTFPEVVEVTELMTGHENIHVKAVGAEDHDITRVAQRIDDLDVEINDENLIRTEHTKPLDYVAISEMIEVKE